MSILVIATFILQCKALINDYHTFLTVEFSLESCGKEEGKLRKIILVLVSPYRLLKEMVVFPVLRMDTSSITSNGHPNCYSLVSPQIKYFIRK